MQPIVTFLYKKNTIVVIFLSLTKMHFFFNLNFYLKFKISLSPFILSLLKCVRNHDVLIIASVKSRVHSLNGKSENTNA